jgi:group I intron endonuclease
MDSGIYEIRNIITGDLYIGSTINFDERERRHYSLLRNGKHTNIFLQNAVNKYGLENFVFSILEECEPDNETLLQKETLYIESETPRYNLMSAKCGRFQHSEESKKKIIETLKKSFLDNPEKAKAISLRNKGRKHTEEAKKKVSLANKGKKKIWKSGLHPMQGKIGAMKGKTGSLCPAYGRKGSLNAASKKVKQLDKYTNEVIKIFDSVSLACEAVGIKSRTDIARVCTSRQKTAGGYRWEYVEENQYIPEIINNNKICQFSQNMEFIKEWDSSLEVSREFKCMQRAIERCCRGKQKLHTDLSGDMLQIAMMKLSLLRKNEYFLCYLGHSYHYSLPLPLCINISTNIVWYY